MLGTLSREHPARATISRMVRPNSWHLLTPAMTADRRQRPVSYGMSERKPLTENSVFAVSVSGAVLFLTKETMSWLVV